LDSEVFVFTAAKREAREHRERTIDQPVGVEEIRAYAARAADRLDALGLREARCWGSIPGTGNLRSWQRMQPGHWGLLYAGDGRFSQLLRVAQQARYVELARHLWGEDRSGDTWELMFFFDRALPIDLEIGEVREAFGFGEDWWPRGLHYPAGKYQRLLLEKFGSVEAFASTAGDAPSAAPAEVGEPPSPEELLFGRPFAGVPSKPPKARKQREPADPDRSGRGHLAHQRTVAKLEKHIGRSSFHTGKKGVNHDGAWNADGAYCICEVKSITPRNEVDQLRKGLGQVLHNRFKTKRHRVDVRAYLIAEREPSNSQLWRELAEEQGIVFTWPERFESDVKAP
jgi:hypothetical protein